MGSPVVSPVNGKPTPPPGYKLDITPPPGYELDPLDYSSVPTFIGQGIDLNKVKQVPQAPTQEEQENQEVAKVNTETPYTIHVLDPKLFDANDRNHELTHTYQDTRNKRIGNVSTQIDPKSEDPYDYGGVEGLKAARISHKTVSDFSYEQQAEMVRDYKQHHDQYLKKAASGKITSTDERKMYALQQAYHPYIRQLADMPSENEKMDRNSLLELLGIQKPVSLSNPEPPGLPPYDTPGLGVLPADPLMGGKSQSTAPKDSRSSSGKKKPPAK